MATRCKVVFTYNSSEEGAKETLKLLGKNGIKYKVDLVTKKIDDLFDLVKKNLEGWTFWSIMLVSTDPEIF